MFVHFLNRLPYIKNIIQKIYETDDAIDNLRCILDVPDELFIQFQQDRHTAEYQSVFDLKEPLVSICVATYNRSKILTERCLKSIIQQNYQNIEIIVVGDGCTDDTEWRISTINDQRIRFINLSHRGDYPVDPQWRWMVAGTVPVNYALDIARGDFITHLDDDDEYSQDRIRKLVDFIQCTRADIVWHPFLREIAFNKWQLKKSPYFRKNQVTTSSIFYHRWLKRIYWDINAYKYREPGDWNRFRKFVYIGCTRRRFPEPLLKHYKEREQRGY
jgi:glycosyltransferase involved in cell wall biosynthesis